MMAKGNWPKWVGVVLLVSALAVGATARNGAWFDEVIIQEATTSGAAVQQIQAGVIDAYAFSVGDADLFNIVQDDPNLDYVMSFGGFNDLTFNHGGPYSENGTLNPFGVAEFREAMHWLIDREYIANEIWKGLSVPKYSYLNSAFADAVRYRDIMDEIEDYYAHDPEKAYGIMEEVMLDLGAYREGGIWYWEGEPVEIIVLIRVEDERLALGGYVAGLLEEFGFQVTRMERVSSELVPLWILSEPDAGLWHVYTGGWITTAISRDQGTGFNQFHTGRVLPWPLFTPLTDEKVNAVVPGLVEVLDKLANRNYASMEERRDLFEEALWGCNKFANMIWVVDNTSFAPFANDIAFAADLAGGFVGSTMWANPAYRMDADGNPIEGGTFTVATSELLIEPWNPIAGSNWVYDMFPIRATGEFGTAMGVNTGLVWPLHFERGEVFIKEGLPVGLSDGEDWCTLEFVPEIVVPEDAWADWDAETQTFITVGEKYPDGVTDATRKSVVYYPESLYDVPLHDGSTISIGDFILGIILSFDRAKPESPIYDESAVPGYNSFMSSFRGVKIVSENPLVIETYSSLYTLDAENGVSTWFPYYAQGPGFWHVISLGILAEQEKVMAFSADKAEKLEIEWCNLITGPSLEIMEEHLVKALQAGFIPYEPTMGQYVDFAEASLRWNNLWEWYKDKGHFWVATGVFYLDGVFPTEKVLTLKRFEDYPFPADRFQFLIDERP
jgi:peptide/nickel transport system substrate-binding protein